MHQALKPLTVLSALLAFLMAGCSGTDEHTDPGKENRGEHSRERGHDREGGEHGRERGHDGEGGEHGREGGHDREGEESGTELALDATYDKVRNGARLILAYEAASNSFVGTVENTTQKTLEAVRVEVHLSNGKELGPTPAEDLAAGKKRPVRLTAKSTDFEGWSAHPEVGRNEHGHERGEGHGAGGEGRGEHGRERRGEHKSP